MSAIRLFSFRVCVAILLCTPLLIAGCGDDSSHRTAGTQQMGGAIQGNELVLAGITATFVGEEEPTADGDRTSVALVYPYGITVANDNFYVTEMFNHTIRKIEMPSGKVTTLAGVAGSAGLEDSIDGVARFDIPLGITSAGSNLYVCDGGNHTIRQVEIASGLVSTLAGGADDAGFADGTGTAARFNNPNSIATDGTYLYVSDTNNHAVRRIAIATGEVTTLAGSSAREEGSTDGSGAAARFYYPNGIAIGGGHLYVVDTYNHTIRRIVIASGEVTTLAGSAGDAGSTDGSGSDARFNMPRGIFLDGEQLYVTDSSNTVRKIVIATAEVTTVAGIAMASGATDDIGTQARFNAPRGIVGLGNSLYVSDTENHLIRAIDVSIPENTVSTFAGFIRREFSEMTTDGRNLYVCDVGTRTIQQIDIVTGMKTTLAGRFGTIGSTDGDSSVALFNYPMGITTDGTNLYVTDYHDSTIRVVSIASGEVSTLAGSAGAYGSADGIGTAAEFDSPAGITTDGTNLYVADMSNQTIRQIVIATGEVTTVAGSPGNSGSVDGSGSDARFYYPMGITTDGTNLYVTDIYNSAIRQIVIATGAVTTLAGSARNSGSADGTGSDAQFYYPLGITTDGTNLFVTDSANNNIRQIVIASAEVTTLAGIAGESGATDGSAAVALFNGPKSVTTDGKMLYIVDASTKVRTIR